MKLGLWRFVFAKNNKPLKIHQQLCVVYFEDFMTESGGRRCCLMLKMFAQTFTMNTKLADQVSDWLKIINAKIQEICLFKPRYLKTFYPQKFAFFRLTRVSADMFSLYRCADLQS